MNKYLAIAIVWVASAIIAVFNPTDPNNWLGWSVGATALILFFG